MTCTYSIVYLRDILQLRKEQLADINALLAQLGPNIQPISWEYLKRVIEESIVVIAQDDTNTLKSICGIACLAPVTAITGRVGIITHIVTDASHQRRGIGTELVGFMVREAQRLGLRRLDLTSHVSRTAAQEFWAKQGFKRRETNNFRLELS
jgi:ribosomal protein S18 acetylase RimI-like enzyme